MPLIHSSDPFSDETQLVDWLKDRDADCPLCGYNLRGLQSPRCPECGGSLKLSVSLVEPYLKAWIALITALLLPAGIGAILIFLISYALFKSGFSSMAISELTRMPFAMDYLMLHLIASVPLSILAIIRRRRFLAWQKQTQRSCVLLAWVALLASISCLTSQVLR